METVVRVRHLGKTFKIFNRTLDRLKEALHPFRRKYHSAHAALKDVSFDIHKGEFVGIVGRNGAGKSTLLKLLSGEMTPTAGEIEVHGSVALLQLGVGFDSELSGIENARFAGTLMGFSPGRIEVMIKDVEEFAEIGEFIHHPLKTYSTGMYSRLAFAIAVNVDPDILIADEVLSVGDIRFSQRCLRKMREFKQRGKTVILVTHDSNTIGIFCDRAIWIKDGTIFAIGDSQAVAEDYNNYMLYNRLPVMRAPVGQRKTSSEADGNESDWFRFVDAKTIGGEKVKITKARLVEVETGLLALTIRGDTRLRLELVVEASEDVEGVFCGFLLNDSRGIIALHLNSLMSQTEGDRMVAGETAQFDFSFRLPSLSDGEFVFALSAGFGFELDHRAHDVLALRVQNPKRENPQLGYVTISEFKVEKRNIDANECR